MLTRRHFPSYFCAKSLLIAREGEVPPSSAGIALNASIAASLASPAYHWYVQAPSEMRSLARFQAVAYSTGAFSGVRGFTLIGVGLVGFSNLVMVAKHSLAKPASESVCRESSRGSTPVSAGFRNSERASFSTPFDPTRSSTTLVSLSKASGVSVSPRGSSFPVSPASRVPDASDPTAPEPSDTSGVCSASCSASSCAASSCLAGVASPMASAQAGLGTSDTASTQASMIDRSFWGMLAPESARADKEPMVIGTSLSRASRYDGRYSDFASSETGQRCRALSGSAHRRLRLLV